MNKLFSIQTGFGNRVFGLDIFRAAAIMMVVLGHGNFLLEKLPFHFLSIPLPDGVDLFFVLSGFLVGGILIKNFTGQDSFNSSMVFKFLKRRWFRTLPNYYLFLLINILLIYFGIRGGELNKYTPSFFLFLQNFIVPFDFMFWESWSLSVEEWFYFSLPFTILPFYVVFRGRISKKNILLLVILLFLFWPLVYRICQAKRLTVDAIMFDVHFRKIVLARIDMIMYGVLGAFVKKYYLNFWEKNKNLFFFPGLGIIFFLLFLDLPPDSFFSKTFSFSIMGFAILLLLPKADSVSSFRSGFGKAVTFISIISYSMYLTNSIVANIIRKYFFSVSTSVNFLNFFTYLFTVILFSFFVYRLFEKPMMDLRDKI